MISKYQIAEKYQQIQDEICEGLENLDRKAKFKQDLWEREEGGGGRTRIIQNGSVIEKGGVNFSAVYGELPELLQKELKLEKGEFFATGVSIVLHPNNPFVPIIHMNIRYFEIDGHTKWFGGGIDLTPHYVQPELAKSFHQKLKTICDKYSLDFYPKHKKWADDYFFIKHRDETRGVGGIFFDKLRERDTLSYNDIFHYTCELGQSFVDIYSEQVNANRDKSFTERNKNWQLIRRGRYVEFNLVYDRGTKFGLETNGRIESILMSLPKDASWVYNFNPEQNSDEAKTLTLLKKDIDWINS